MRERDFTNQDAARHLAVFEPGADGFDDGGVEAWSCELGMLICLTADTDQGSAGADGLVV